jgi:hypothetical protein
VCVEALVLVGAGPVGALAGGGIAVGCAALIAVVAAVSAAQVGTAIGQATSPMINEVRGDPTERRWTPPLADPHVGRAIALLLEMNTPDIHIGLPGGGRLPELCRDHKTACTTALLAFTGGVSVLLALFGGPEKAEERFWEPPETGGETDGGGKSKVLR